MFNIYIYGEELPRIEPLPYYLELSRQVGNLTDDQFLQGALLASASPDMERDLVPVKKYINQLIDKLEMNLGKYEKGETILQLLHSTVLNTYIEDQTKINTLMNNGSYNCVSSAVLYMAAARAAELEIHGVRTIDHVFVSVQTGNNEIIDVETTNEWGFDPGQKKEFTDSFSGSTGYSYVPPGIYSQRKIINDKQMIGLILQNRISELQRNNYHRAALPLAIDRYALTLTEDAKRDMYDTFSNYASQLNGTGQYEEGLDFLRKTIARWGASEKVINATEALVHNFTLSLMERGRSDEAELFINELELEGLLSFSAIQADKIMIYEKRIVDLLNSGSSYSEVKLHLNRIYENGFLTKGKWINYTIYLYIKESEKLANSQGWLAAYLFVKNAPADIVNQQKYRQLLSSCKGNYAVTIHNKFADFYNKGLYSEAERIIQEGLSYLPDNSTFNSDLQMVRNKSF